MRLLVTLSLAGAISCVPTPARELPVTAAFDSGVTFIGHIDPPDVRPPAAVVNEVALAVVDNALRCKVLNDRGIGDPTANDVQSRFNIAGADLGISVVDGDVLRVFFGDTIGHRAIWPAGEDPDSIASIPLADVVADVTSLCRSLEFAVTADVPSVANAVDPSVLRDFAGAFMTPPPNEDIGAYIAQPAGPFANIPGTFEVPAGALAIGGEVLVFYAGLVEEAPRYRATRSYLARFDRASGYQIVRGVDALGDGALGGRFIQIAPVEKDGVVYLFGTGDYRRSGVSLARVPSANLQSGEGTEVLELDFGADAESDGVGELSVIVVDDLFVALYQRELHDGETIIDNRLILRVAAHAEGPWTEAATLVDMADPAFQAAHCCADVCEGDQIVHCDRAGLYAAYLVPAVDVVAVDEHTRSLTIPYLVSTWDPYNVVLFSTTVHVSR